MRCFAFSGNMSSPTYMPPRSLTCNYNYLPTYCVFTCRVHVEHFHPSHPLRPSHTTTSLMTKAGANRTLPLKAIFPLNSSSQVHQTALLQWSSRSTQVMCCGADLHARLRQVLSSISSSLFFLSYLRLPMVKILRQRVVAGTTDHDESGS